MLHLMLVQLCQLVVNILMLLLLLHHFSKDNLHGWAIWDLVVPHVRGEKHELCFQGFSLTKIGRALKKRRFCGCSAFEIEFNEASVEHALLLHSFTNIL